ncbi:MAG TPA: carboxypeptidase-like regulatory domain-containing protein, partial [Acidimicrobiia bacterium]|nr:carboxypeptidase-like regulatory domain-containing protein [Acidimicrobiia bacterium]
MRLVPSVFRRVAAVSLVFAAALPFPFAHAAEADGHLAGRIIDSSGAALSGAEVTVTERLSGATDRTATDNHGRYGLDVAPGRYDLEVSGQVAGRPVTARVNGVTIGADTERDVLVIPHAVDFEGTLRDGTGTPIPNAWVRLGDAGERTGTDGRFHIRSLPGTHRLSVEGHQYTVSVEHFTLNADTERDLVVPTKIPVEVNVRDEDGHTVDDARVSFDSSEQDAPFELLPGKKTAARNWISYAKADGAGHVEFDALPTAEPVLLRVSPPFGSPLKTAELTIDPLSAPRRIDVVLPWAPRPGDPSGAVVSLSGTVRNLDGSVPAGDAGLYLFTPDGQEAWHAEVLGGSFSLAAPPGPYRLRVYGSDYAWVDEDDGSEHDGFDFSAEIDDFHLSGDRTVDLRLPFAPTEVVVVDHTGQPAAGDVTIYTEKTGVELLPGATGKAEIRNDERAGPDGRAMIMTVPGRRSSVSVEPDAQRLSPYSGNVTPIGDRLTVNLPTPIPVRFTDEVRGPSACARFEVTGEDGGSRWPESDPTCTVGLQAGPHHLTNYSDSWGDSGDVEFEWYWIDADFTVSGPATLDLHLPASNRAQIDIVSGNGDPIGGALTMDSATERVDLGSGIEATVTVSNRYLDMGDALSSFNAHLFGPTTFSGTFRSDD